MSPWVALGTVSIAAFVPMGASTNAGAAPCGGRYDVDVTNEIVTENAAGFDKGMGGRLRDRLYRGIIMVLWRVERCESRALRQVMC